jgi:hypothetical protein
MNDVSFILFNVTSVDSTTCEDARKQTRVVEEEEELKYYFKTKEVS